MSDNRKMKCVKMRIIFPLSSNVNGTFGSIVAICLDAVLLFLLLYIFLVSFILYSLVFLFFFKIVLIFKSRICVDSKEKPLSKIVDKDGSVCFISARTERVENFEKFKEECKSYYKELKKKSNKDMVDVYGLDVVANGRWGGRDKRQFELFYGSCLFDTQESYDKDLKPKIDNLPEYGSSLQFVMNDHGFVDIFLTPARTDMYSWRYSSLLIKRHIDPKCLLSKRLQKKLWNDFISCMMCTCIHEDFGLCDRIRYSWVKFTSHKIVGDKIEETELWKWVKEIFKWVFTVSLSGLSLFFLQRIFK